MVIISYTCSDSRLWLRCGSGSRFGLSEWSAPPVSSASRSRSEGPGSAGRDTPWAAGRTPCRDTAAWKGSKPTRSVQLSSEPFWSLGWNRTSAWRKLLPHILVDLQQDLVIFEVGVPAAVWVWIQRLKKTNIHHRPGSEKSVWTFQPEHTQAGYGKQIRTRNTAGPAWTNCRLTDPWFQNRNRTDRFCWVFSPLSDRIWGHVGW